MNVAVLGSGFMGATHARAFAKLDGVTVLGVSSRSAQKAEALANEVGAEVFTDARTLVTHASVDAVSVTLPTPLHEDYVVAALEAGKHVFVEKPMALTLPACDRMIAAAKTSGKLLMVAHVMRFWAEYLAIADVLEGKTLGAPLAATGRRLSSPPGWGDWFKNPEMTGGAVHDLLIHDYDVLTWLFGKPDSVYATGRKSQAGAWDHVFTLTRHGEVACALEGSFLMPEDYPFTMSLWVLCERGSVEFTFRAGGAGVETGDAGGTTLAVYEAGKDPRHLDYKEGDAFEREVDYFVACVKTGRQPDRATATQGRAAVEVALAARKSLDTRQVVNL